MRKLIAVLLLLVVPVMAAADDTPEYVKYPRVVETPNGKVVVHAPQIESWEEFERIKGIAALEVTPADTGETQLGAGRFSGRTVTDIEARTVTFYDIEIDSFSFPQNLGADAEKLEGLVRSLFARSQQTVPLDLVLQYLQDDIIPQGSDKFSFEPPRIIYATTDSRLITFDGPPMLAPIKGVNLQFVVNTNWDLFYYTADGLWYLRDDQRWVSSPGDKKPDGNWQVVTDLPDDFADLPLNSNWNDVRNAVPPATDESPLPDIYMSEEPTELLLIDGEPQLAAIDDTGISYVTNTELDVFRLDDTWYFLTSGRWFMAEELDGEWQAVSELPAAFAAIPADSPRARVLVSVPGTTEAKIAILEASIPRKAQVSRDYTAPVKIDYAGGRPEFEKIEPTDVYRAVNTNYTVLLANELFYLCYNGAWFVATDEHGPWKIAEQIPAEIYKIPPSSPAYNCTHVYVYPNQSDDNAVTTGYDSGYLNSNVSFTVMYGTGYYYYPYYYYPYYYGYPRSYGEAAWYNPATGNFGARQAVVGPYGGASRTAIYNPETGTYGRGRAVWDDDAIARQGIAYNPRNGNGVATDRYRSEDYAWSESLVKRDDEWLYREREREGNTANAEFETSGGASGSSTREFEDGKLTGSGEVTKDGNTVDTEMVRTEDGVARKFTDEDGNSAGYVRNDDGDLYAGKDGEVYKREDGEWYKHGDDGWDPVEPDGGTAGPAAEARGGEARSDAAVTSEFGDLSQYRQMGSGAATERPTTSQDLDMGRVPNFENNPAWQGGTSRQQLDRHYDARRGGYERYNNVRGRGRAGRSGGMRRH